MIRSTVAHVDLAALQANFRAIQEFLAGGSDGPPLREAKPAAGSPESGAAPPGIIAVVKANAYGHGSQRVALALEQAGATMLAVADIEEGIVLRRGGVRVPILVFGALSVSDLDGLFEFSLTPTISTPSAARAVQAAAAKRHAAIRVSPEDRHRDEPARLPPRQPAAHAARAARQREPARSTRSTRTSRRPTCPRARSSTSSASGSRRRWPRSSGLGGTPRLRHAANSAALLRDSRVWYDVVRPGLLLYGIVPPPLASTIPLRPVMSLTSRVVAVKGLRPGEGRRIRLAIHRRSAAHDRRRSRRLRGRRRHAHGRPRPRPDSRRSRADRRRRLDGHDDRRRHGSRRPCNRATRSSSSGSQGDESWQQIDAREVASAIGTIPWEIVCRLGTRVERHYTEPNHGEHRDTELNRSSDHVSRLPARMIGAPCVRASVVREDV